MTAIEIPVDRVRPNPLNPRRELEGLDDLANSMAEIGLVQEILVMEADDDGFYVLLAGHRRTAAATMLGWMTIPASIRPALDETAQLELLLAANANSGLSPIEEADAFDSLVKSGKSQREVAARVGRDQSHVSRRLELLKLSAEDQEKVHRGKLTVGKALKSLKPQPEKAPQVEPPTIPDSLRPDPIDAMEPIGYKVIELNGDGEYVDDWDSVIHPTPEAARADIANTEFHGEQHILVPVALVLLPPVDVSAGTQEPSPSDVESVAGGEEEGLAVPVSERSDTGPLATAIDEGIADGIAAAEGTVAEAVAPPEELSEERKAALVTFARTWAQIGAADEETVRESAEHEFSDSPGDAERAVKLWETALANLGRIAS